MRIVCLGGVVLGLICLLVVVLVGVLILVEVLLQQLIVLILLLIDCSVLVWFRLLLWLSRLLKFLKLLHEDLMGQAANSLLILWLVLVLLLLLVLAFDILRILLLMLSQWHLVLAGHCVRSTAVLLLRILLHLHLLTLKCVLQLLRSRLALPCSAITLLGETLLALQLGDQLGVLQLLRLLRLWCTWKPERSGSTHGLGSFILFLLADHLVELDLMHVRVDGL